MFAWDETKRTRQPKEARHRFRRCWENL